MKRLLRILIEPLRRIGMLIGRINTLLLIGISFYLVLTPIGFARRVFSRRSEKVGWKKRSPLDRRHYEKQY